MRLLPVLLPLLVASVAFAQSPPPADSPVSPQSDAPTVAQTAPLDTQPSAVSLRESPRRPPHWGVQFGLGAVAGVVAVPASIYLGAWLGSLSNNLIGGALPSLLCFGLIPPVVVSLVTWLVGNFNEGGTFRLWPSLLVTLVINGAAMAIAGVFGVSFLEAGAVMILALVDGIVLSAASTGTMRLFPLKEQPKAFVINQRDPRSPATFVAQLSEVKF